MSPQIALKATDMGGQNRDAIVRFHYKQDGTGLGEGGNGAFASQQVAAYDDGYPTRKDREASETGQVGLWLRAHPP